MFSGVSGLTTPGAVTWARLPRAPSLQALCGLHNSAPFPPLPLTVPDTCSQTSNLCSAHFLPEEHSSVELIFLLLKEGQNSTLE